MNTSTKILIGVGVVITSGLVVSYIAVHTFLDAIEKGLKAADKVPLKGHK